MTFVILINNIVDTQICRKEMKEMLTKCIECDSQVSDKALICPHCGFPMKKERKEYAAKTTGKRLRLPNGFGQISEIKNRNLRNPFRAMVTVGKTPAGKYIVKPLKPQCYFASYNEAYAALIEYNKNPYDLGEALTVKELYEQWTEGYFKTLKSPSGIRTVKAAWSYCSSIYDMRVMDVRARHIKGCMENGTIEVKGKTVYPTAGMKARIKSMFNLMLDYALEYEIVERNYARTFNISEEIIQEQEKKRREHIPFSDEEMELLWENVDKKQYIDVILIQCYSGWRPQEIGLLRLENVDLEGWTIQGGMKTKAGANRIVPIHPRIRGLIQRRYEQAVEIGSAYLFNCIEGMEKRGGMMLSYDKYQKRFCKIRDELNLNPLHRPHDGRMHFITMAKKWKVDEYAIKYIVGHSITDLTERVYTKRDIEWLRSEMEKIEKSENVLENIGIGVV